MVCFVAYSALSYIRVQNIIMLMKGLRRAIDPLLFGPLPLTLGQSPRSCAPQDLPKSYRLDQRAPHFR